MKIIFKLIIFFVGFLLINSVVKAQTSMYINLKDGKIVHIPSATTSLDSITYINYNSGLLATLTTAVIGNLGSISPTSGGNISNVGTMPITGSGICWSTSPMPTILDNTTYDGIINFPNINFTSTLRGLLPATTYYVRAYVINGAGIAYGNQISFFNTSVSTCTGGPNTVTDIDGNVYNVVTIGSQCWFQENLKVTHYRNGDLINANSNSYFNGQCLDYNNDTSISVIYGKLYNHYTVTNPAGLCPTGWHVPADWEWDLLIRNIDSAGFNTNCAITAWYCCESTIAGGEMKEIGLNHWLSPNAGATNSSGFNALPGGNGNGGTFFYGLGESGGWWTATTFGAGNAFWRETLYGSACIKKDNDARRRDVLSVRCVKD